MSLPFNWKKRVSQSHSILQLKPLALYFARAETALAGIPMNVKSLSTIVATFMENKNAEQLAASLIEAPVTFIKSFSGTIAMKPLSPDEIFSNSTSTEISPSSPSDFHSLLSSEISSEACPAQNIVLPPNPLVTSRSPDKDPESLTKGPTSAEKRTPAHPKTKKHRRRTLCFTPNPKRNQEEPSCPNTVTPRETGKPWGLTWSLSWSAARDWTHLYPLSVTQSAQPKMNSVHS